MKKIITFSSIGIAASMLLSSCGSNISIAKRHFNNGYYIAYSKDKHVNHAPKEEKEIQPKTGMQFYSSENKAEENTADYSQQSPVTGNNEVVASNEKIRHKATLKQSIKQALKQKTKIIEYPPTKINRALFETPLSSSHAADNDALSLFWVVILVILILWALGFLTGGFGIGGLINLLLVIALILLILWLLRIV